MTAADTFHRALSEALPKAYVAAYRRLGDGDSARDVCQEAASRALKARASYDAERPFYPWFYRIVQNLCRDAAKRRSVDRRSVEPEPGSLVDPRPGVERRLIETERTEALTRAIEGLPPELREMIELRHFQDLSYREMAEILGCPEGTVMSRLFRARRALRAALGGA